MDNQGSYVRVRERLEEIVAQVRAKDVPLEKSLDLYEEALRLGGICAEMIDRTDFTEDELASLQSGDKAEDSNPSGTEDVASEEQKATDLGEGVSEDEALDSEEQDDEDRDDEDGTEHTDSN